MLVRKEARRHASFDATVEDDVTTMVAGVAALIAPIILESAALRLECI
jgi:hypothetical protein